MNACTIIARNYRAHSLVLARSYLAHHPGGSFTTLIIDEREGTDDYGDSPDRILTPYEIGIEPGELHRMAAIYSVTEFATAVKPWLLRTLLQEDETITYLDPDIQVFDALDDIDREAREHGIVLTPHTLVPLPRDGMEPSETLLLRAGMFNLGFVSVGRKGQPFLDWWSERLARDCIVAPDRGRFVDQRWVDFVPTLFDHSILRDPALNVAWWNLSDRTVRHDDVWRVDEKPIRFFHFSGYSPETPTQLTKYAGQVPRVLLKDEPGLRELCEQYARLLREEGYETWRKEPYGLDMTSVGVRLDGELRTFYRQALEDAELKGRPLPPDPFAPEEAGDFVDWLLGEAPSDLHRPIEARFVGYFRTESGVGEAARQLVRGASELGVPHSTYTYTNAVSRQDHPFEDVPSPSGDPAVNIVCVNADQVPIFAQHVGPAFFADRHTIGVWFWEAPTFPASMHAAFDFVDEIWVASTYVADAVSAATEKPVCVFPLPVEVPVARNAQRPLELPEGFMFLFSFDFLSVFQRKNPLAVIRAFTAAFSEGEGPLLVIKTINGDRDQEHLDELRAAGASRSDIRIIDGYLSADENRALMASCDAYVSLHRSEGFGFTMAEAMAAGKPVIATAHGGNMTFMTDENSLLVPFELVKIGDEARPYPTDGMWADPDVSVAAELMRRVVSDPDSVAPLGHRAARDIAERHSAAAAGEFVQRRLQQIAVERAAARIRGVDVTARAATAAPAITRAEAVQAHGVGDLFMGRAGISRPVRFARAALRRLLWPSLAHQSDVDRTLLEALRELESEFHTQGLRIGGLEARAKGAGEAMDRRVAELERLTSTGGILDDVARRLDTLQGQMAQLLGDLHAVPYMSDPGFLERAAQGGDARFTGDHGLYLGFEAVFRGGEDFIRERQRIYVPLVEQLEPVLDVGCGRGEFLDLMAEAGIDASGVDLLPEMVAHVREKGHRTELADANDYLEQLPDHSLGTIFAAQVIEHLAFDELLRFFRLALRKLRPEGQLIAETVNPHSVAALKAFWVDPTHKSPIFPEVAVALAVLSGFGSTRIFHPNGVGDAELDRVQQGEYALIAINDRIDEHPRLSVADQADRV